MGDGHSTIAPCALPLRRRARREPGRDTLIGVDTAQGPLGEAQLLFLRRFYLETPGEPPPDPGATGTASLVTLPASFALALQQLVAALPSAAIYGLLASSYALIHGLVGRVVFGFGDLAALGGYATLTGLALGAAAGSPFALGAGFASRARRQRLLWRGCRPLRRSPGAAGQGAGRRDRDGRPHDRARRIFAPDDAALPHLGAPLARFADRACESAELRRHGDADANAFRRDRARRSLVPPGLSALVGLRACNGEPSRKTRSPPPCWASIATACSPRASPSRPALAGLSGYVLTVHFGQTGYAYGFTLGLKALVGAVLGGIGSIGAAFAGGVILAFSEAGWSAMFSVDSRDLAVYSLLAILFIFRPYGIFGRRPDSPSLS